MVLADNCGGKNDVAFVLRTSSGGHLMLLLAKYISINCVIKDLDVYANRWNSILSLIFSSEILTV